ncbi:MAG: hypothetical protein Q7J31_04520 [Syntrophales bacterium]|nr:hypothetical protein [Syntrophales bacterium]
MQEDTYKYVAKKAVEDLRTQIPISDGLAYDMNAFPLIDYCRKFITNNDKDWIIDTASKTTNPPLTRELAISLMHPIKDDPKIHDFLFQTWKKSRAYNIKLQIIWRLVDYKDLPVEMHRDIYRKFVVPNWDKWVPYLVDKCGGKNGVLNDINKRLNNPAFPPSKAWVYLTVVTGCRTADRPAAKMLIESYFNSQDSINAEVSKDLIDVRKLI